MNAALEHVLALHTRALAPVAVTRGEKPEIDVRHAAVGVLAKSWKPWRISFAMHRAGGRS